MKAKIIELLRTSKSHLDSVDICFRMQISADKGMRLLSEMEESGKIKRVNNCAAYYYVAL